MNNFLKMMSLMSLAAVLGTSLSISPALCDEKKKDQTEESKKDQTEESTMSEDSKNDEERILSFRASRRGMPVS